jgi:hypothetical protein
VPRAAKGSLQRENASHSRPREDHNTFVPGLTEGDSEISRIENLGALSGRPNTNFGFTLDAPQRYERTLARQGAIIDGPTLAAATPRFLGYGAIKAIAGSHSRLAVATSIGQVLIFRSSDFSLETTVNYAAGQLALSADGSVLAMRASGLPNPLGGYDDDTVRTISLPSGTVINTWPYTSGSAGTPYAVDITLSDSGALLGQTLSINNYASTRQQVTSSNGGPILWSITGGTGGIRISLDDTLIAAPVESNNSVVTGVYLNGTLSTQIPGSVSGWLPNNQLLVGTSIFDSAGIKQAGPVLPAGIGGPLQMLTPTSFFDVYSRAIYSLSTGEKIWSTPDENVWLGTVAGSRVVLTTALYQILIEPY